MAVSPRRPRLAHEGEYLRALLHSINASVMACDMEGNVLPNLAAIESGLPEGWKLDDLEEALRQTRHTDGRRVAVSEAPLYRAMQGETVCDFDLLVYDLTGSPPRVISCDARPVVDEDGQQRGAVLVIRDVTEHRRVDRLHSCDMEISRILTRPGSLTDLAEPILTSVARAVRARYGEFWLTDDVGGTDNLIATWAPAALPPDDDRSTLHPITIPLSTNGQRFGSMVLTSTETIEDEATEVLNAIGERIVDFDLRRRNEDLELELARTKGEFIALGGHTLRTPLTSIASLTELLLANPGMAAEERELLERIRTNAGTLRGIVDDLLMLAGIESGHISLHLGPVDLAQIVEDAVAAATPAATPAGVDLTADLPDELHTLGDGPRLRQAVDNLLSNAVKYSPDGGEVQITLHATASVAELTIADQGMGVPYDEREWLFGRFYRGASAHERGIPGTGLGLTLVRLIADRHGGAVTLADNDGPGATFCLRLPIRNRES